MLAHMASDRLTRNPMQLEAIVALLEATDTRVHTVTAGEYDLSTASGRMCARLIGAVARHESELKGERLRSQARQEALTGRARCRSIRPFGFEMNQVQHRPNEAKAVRWAARQVLAGRTLTYIARRMPPSVTGLSPWNVTVLTKMLTSGRIAGFREYRGEIVAVAEWKPILDREKWLAVRKRLIDDRVRRAPPRQYLLSGVVFDYKGLRMYGRMNERGVREYGSRPTSAGPGCMVSADELDAVVLMALRLHQRVRRHQPRPAVDWDDTSLLQRRELIRDTFEPIIITTGHWPDGRVKNIHDRVMITPRIGSDART